MKVHGRDTGGDDGSGKHELTVGDLYGGILWRCFLTIITVACGISIWSGVGSGDNMYVD